VQKKKSMLVRKQTGGWRVLRIKRPAAAAVTISRRRGEVVQFNRENATQL
jgi:hypothetical protein